MARRAGVNSHQFAVTAPFVDGYVSDLPAELLGPRMASKLENIIFPRGVAERRRGWSYDGSVADGSNDNFVVARAAFGRVGVSMTLVGDDVGEVFIHNNAGAGTSLAPAASWKPAYPRCIYRDEIIFCHATDFTGESHGIVRYGGGQLNRDVSHNPSATYSIAASEARVTWTGGVAITIDGLAGFASPYVSVAGRNQTVPEVWHRVARGAVASRSVTLERMLASAATALTVMELSAIGKASSCIALDPSEGTFTHNGVTTFTGQGTSFLKYADIATGFVELQPKGTASYVTAPAITTDSAITAAFPARATPTQYKLTASMPFRDCTVFRGCLIGGGVPTRDNDVFYGAPGADIGLYPKYWSGADVDPGVVETSIDPETDYLMPHISVPSVLDADVFVALLATQHALYVLKRSAVYRITGDWPTFRVDKVDDGIGCLHIRSAVTDESGVYWAGDTGIWTIRGGQPFNLAGGEGRPGILTEYRNLVSSWLDGVSVISVGVAEGHLMVHVDTSASPTGAQRLFVMDLATDRWTGVFTNVTPGLMWSSRVPGESTRCLAPRASRVIDLSTMFRSATGLPGENAGPANDGDGTVQLAKAWSGWRIFVGDETNEYRLTWMKVAARADETSANGTKTVNVKVEYGDGVGGSGSSEITAGTMAFQSAYGVKSFEFRPGVRGRRMRIKLEQANGDTDFRALEFHEISGDVRMLGSRR